VIVSRPIKFFVIERLPLPLAIMPLRGLIKTWRICPPESPKWAKIAATEHRVGAGQIARPVVGGTAEQNEWTAP
jgi:hypothetical protein